MKKRKMLLGQHTPVVEAYSPGLLYPIPRQEARSSLGIHGVLPFYGVDQWYAYEMSWLDQNARPIARVGRFTIPCTTPNLVESKSFKLYLNSLNNTQYESEQAAINCIEADIGAIAGAPVSLTLLLPDDDALRGHVLTGHSLDNGNAGDAIVEPAANQIEICGDGSCGEEKLFSHLLRSLCPVTGQPDWATVWFHYRGLHIDHDSLLTYIIAYRRHQEFHEQCVERMFRDIYSRCKPDFLHIQAFYTRRGGMDISPFRSTLPDASPMPRLNRQ
jgi:7-cyano-7-deazaguanine reductase